MKGYSQIEIEINGIKQKAWAKYNKKTNTWRIVNPAVFTKESSDLLAKTTIKIQIYV